MSALVAFSCFQNEAILGCSLQSLEASLCSSVKRNNNSNNSTFHLEAVATQHDHARHGLGTRHSVTATLVILSLQGLSLSLTAVKQFP